MLRLVSTPELYALCGFNRAVGFTKEELAVMEDIGDRPEVGSISVTVDDVRNASVLDEETMREV